MHYDPLGLFTYFLQQRRGAALAGPIHHTPPRLDLLTRYRDEGGG